jgi:vancomycin resistance protein YoaR
LLSDKTSKLIIIIGAVLIALIFIVWQMLWFVAWGKSETIANGVEIGGYPVGGYDKDSARQMLGIQLKNTFLNKEIEISYEDIKSTLDAGEFASFSYENRIEEAYGVARGGNGFADWFALARAGLFGISIQPEVIFDDAALSAGLERAASDYLIPAQDAQITAFDPEAAEGQELTVVPHAEGRKLDTEKTMESVKQAVLSGKSEARAYVMDALPEITAEDIRGITAEPVISEYMLNSIYADEQSDIYKVLGEDRYQILLPGGEVSVIEFMGGEDYIYFEMPDGGTGSYYEKILTEICPTQIYLACILSELSVTEREIHDIEAKNVPAGASCITNQYHDMKVKNTLSCPVVIRVGYKKNGGSGRIYCEVLRPQMEYKTLVRSVIKSKENKTLVDITRVYVDNKGNTVDTAVVETVEIPAE